MSQLLIEENEEYFDPKTMDCSFSKEWDDSNILSFPIPYPDPLRMYRELAKEPDTSQLLVSAEASLKGGQRLTEDEFNDLIPTGIIQDLNQVAISARNDRNEVKMAIKNLITVDDTGLRDRIQDSIDDYYEKRVYHHAEEICQHIDGLIELDKYPKKMFGTYKSVRRRIFTEDDHKEADRLLNILIILGRSSVPPDIRYEERQSVEPTINSDIRTVGT